MNQVRNQHPVSCIRAVRLRGGVALLPVHAKQIPGRHDNRRMARTAQEPCWQQIKARQQDAGGGALFVIAELDATFAADQLEALLALCCNAALLQPGAAHAAERQPNGLQHGAAF